MKRILIAEGDGQAVHRRATRHTATAEIFTPPTNPAQSIRDGAGIRLTVQPDGNWQLTTIDAYTPTDPNRTRELAITRGDLRQPNTTRTVADVHLPDTLTASDAYAIICTLADRFRWSHAIFDRDDLGNGDDLTDEHWQRITATQAWHNLSDRVHTLVHRSDLLDEVIEQARIRCTECCTLLNHTPADTEPARCPTRCDIEP
ncbi:hypothetical protein AB0H83_45890 [Dactylosporangium sp. NPDC050688]|uniref:hypothetical protein n=1 Tax=Dactylosporangium sp. NPDC050688 TaxID=3157217 RepID=UPI0033C08DFB